MVRFRRFVMVDYSAASRPVRGANSLWVASRDVGGAATLHNPPTRDEGWALIRALCQADGPVLLGLDVALGAPAGLAGLLGEAGWRGLWGRVAGALTDGPDQRNDRFAVAAALNAAVGPGFGPFWGCPKGEARPTLHPRKVHDLPAGLSDWRHVDQRLRAAGLRPFSVFQTAYAGSVGGQSLLAWPRLLAWARVDPRLRIWPLQTGFVPDPTGGAPDAIVACEVWPSADPAPLPGVGVRDAEQVMALCARFAAADAAGDLLSWFAPALPEAVRADAEREEGWVLGVR